MESIEFPEMNMVIAKNQKGFNHLNANVDPYTPGIPTTVCMKLSDEELAEAIISGGEVWITQLTNGERYRPFRISTTKPEMIKHDLSKLI